jgi:hypothetical protein
LIVGGIAIIVADIASYPLFLPQIMTSESFHLIQLITIVFYILFLAGTMITISGILLILSSLSSSYLLTDSRAKTVLVKLLNDANKRNNDLDKSSPLGIISAIITDRYYFKVLLLASVSYGLFFAIMSGMIIFRGENFSELYGVDIPSVSVMSHGPLGYVPALSIYLTDHLGFLIIPANLLILVTVSSLVGLNVSLSFYAFRFKMRRNMKSAKTHAYMGALASTAAVFTACPTCASLAGFSIIAGSFAPTLIAMAVTYYSVFLILGIPLLLITPFVTAHYIKKMTLGICTVSDSATLKER